jgi:hypothetical protein
VLVAGIRWRAGASIALFVVAVLAFAAAALGPLYLRSTDGAIFARSLNNAPPATTGMTISSVTQAFTGRARYGASPAELRRFVGYLKAHGAGTWFEAPIYDIFAGVTLSVHTVFAQSTLLARSNLCADLQFVAGRCPVGPHETALSRRSAELLGLHVGDQVPLSVIGGRQERFTLVGEYLTPTSTDLHWQGDLGYFNYGTASTTGTYQLDPFVASMSAVGLIPPSLLSDQAKLAFRSGSLHYSESSRFRGELSDWRREALILAHRTVGTRIDSVLASASGASTTVTQSVIVIDIEVTLLALAVLFSLVVITSESREGEAALAQLRGFSRSAMLRVVAIEPMLIVTAAIPFGFAFAWFVLGRLYGPIFPPSLSPHPVLNSLLALMGVYLGSLIAVVLGSLRLLASRFSGAQNRGALQRVRRMRLAILDAVTTAIALAGFIELANGGTSTGRSTNVLAAITPAVLALAAGIIGIRLLPLVLRFLQRVSRHRSNMVTFLVSRSLDRRSSALRQALLVALATSVSVFAIESWHVATVNRSIEADFVVGAAHVLDVAVPPSRSLEGVVNQVDRSGAHAMAAVSVHTSSGQSLAIQLAHAQGILDWPQSLHAGSIQKLIHELTVHTVPPIVVDRGEALRLGIESISSALAGSDLIVEFFDRGAAQQLSFFEPFVPGQHSIQLPIGQHCQASCVLLGIGIEPGGGTALARASSVSFVLTGLSTLGSRGQLHSRVSLSTPGLWVSGGGQAAVHALGVGERFVSKNLGTGIAGIFATSYSEINLPAVVTSDLADAVGLGGGNTGLTLPGLDGNSPPGHMVGEVPALPQLGADATLTGLGPALLVQSAPPLGATDQVWTNQVNDQALKAMLTRLGVRVLQDQSSVGAAQVFGGTALALADDFFVVCAVLGLTLVGGMTAFSIVSRSRTRSIEGADLLSVGVPRRTIGMSFCIEQLTIVVLGTLVGSVAAMIAAGVALPSIPEFTSIPPGPALQFVVSFRWLFGLVGVELALLSVVSLIGARLTLGRSTPDLLRVSPQ